ncbi:hypothetical protein EKG95_28025 [Salmonella enterica subsp. enterica serovar Aqua]|uniref:Uncharacterized protein n=1 Tax=Salmonella enterica subsp. enterica serovar Aqua TaxID=1302615 RepID=A0A5X6ESG4_SALET|nr:hypothetical protein [Salmonella enterica subsp. enterica serovar Aqua]
MYHRSGEINHSPGTHQCGISLRQKNPDTITHPVLNSNVINQSCSAGRIRQNMTYQPDFPGYGLTIQIRIRENEPGRVSVELHPDRIVILYRANSNKHTCKL